MVQTRTAAGSVRETVAPPDKISIVLIVNGIETRLDLAPWTSLLDALRDHLDLTGTKKGCDHGQCGTCTVLVDGRRIYSCLTLAVMQSGSKITTIEGLADGDQLHPVQKAFAEYGAVQCGFCTPGMILAAKVLLESNPHPTDVEIRQGISGNLCRCTGYVKIVEAIQAAARG